MGSWFFASMSMCANEYRHRSSVNILLTISRAAWVSAGMLILRCFETVVTCSVNILVDDPECPIQDTPEPPPSPAPPAPLPRSLPSRRSIGCSRDCPTNSPLPAGVGCRDALRMEFRRVCNDKIERNGEHIKWRTYKLLCGRVGKRLIKRIFELFASLHDANTQKPIGDKLNHFIGRPMLAESAKLFPSTCDWSRWFTQLSHLADRNRKGELDQVAGAPAPRSAGLSRLNATRNAN